MCKPLPITRTSRHLAPRWAAAVLGLGLLLAGAGAGATAVATRGPVASADPASGWVQGALAEGGLAELNAAGSTEQFVPGYSVTTRAAADDSTGQMRGSAAYQLAAPRLLDAQFPAGLPGAFFSSHLSGLGTLGGGTLGETVQLQLTLDFHGAFLDLSGPRDTLLLGQVYVQSFSGRALSYTSNLQFSLAPSSAALRIDALGLAGGTPTSPAYAGALPVVLSSLTTDLRGRAQITFNAEVGQTLFVSADFAGGAGPVVRSGQDQAGGARVEAWGTAGLHLLLPAGLTLEQTSGVLSAPGIASTVPEPAGHWLWLAAGPLLWLRRRRHRVG